MSELGWQNLLVVLSYFVVIFAVGIYASCKSRKDTVSGFFLADRSMPFYLVGASMFVSNIGSEHFIGLAGSASARGVGIAAWEFNALLFIQLLGFIFIPVYIASRTITMPEYMEIRFGGRRIRTYYAVLSLLFYIFTKCSVNLYTGALFIQQSLKWDMYVCIVIQLVIVAILNITGGLTAVIYTDFMQALLMVAGALALTGKSFVAVGGFENLWKRFPLAEPNVTVPGTDCHKVISSWDKMLKVCQDLEHHEHHTHVLAAKSTKRKFLDAVIDFIGGVAGGTASVYIGQPLDTVKVKLQSFPSLYSNAYQCFKTTFQKEGVYRGLYAGTLPSLAAQVGENSVLFLAYGQCQKIIATMLNKNKTSDLNALENAVSGSMAAFFSSFVLCPTELIKCKLQAMREMSFASADPAASQKHIGPWQLTRQILRTEGVPGMFRGLVPTFVREIPGYFFFFGGYELAKVFLTPEGSHKDDIGPIKTMICGGVGGVAIWTAIFPSDVIKSRIQIGTAGMDTSLSFVGMVRKVAREEGVRALYKGLGPTLLRTFPATGGLFLAYESTKKYLGQSADWMGVE